MTDKEYTILHHRQAAAESALRFFTEKKIIPSSIPGPGSYRAAQAIGKYRADTLPTVMGRFNDAAKTGAGNCSEQSFIVFASLSRNPRLLPNSFVYVADLKYADHTFVVITDKGACNISGLNSLSRLSGGTLVVDPWTNDLYFPNLDIITASSLGFMHRPKTGFQFDVREICKYFEHCVCPTNRLF
ncbi:MAG: hypothetical protein KAH18_00145 [Psychromonas sp.]|nr:hypothetical protein [Psychromonas sp.]